MNRQQLIDEISANERLTLNKKGIAEFLATLATVATKALEAGEAVEIPGLVRLKVAERAARTGRNPQTGAPLAVPAKKVVKAGICKPLANAVAI